MFRRVVGRSCRAWIARRAVADEAEPLSQPVQTGLPTPLNAHSHATQPGPLTAQQYSRINDQAADVLRLHMVYT
jgi:hypothetical protein